MPVLIQLDQAAKPPGVPGRAREDFDTGVAVTAAAVGGPYSAYLWSFISKPIAIFIPAKAATLIASPTGPTTNLSPVNVAGTYEVQLLVDSGSGLGATADDVAKITFYAGTPGSALHGPPSTIPYRLPRRIPAFQETTEHNVPDALDPTGNPEGWSREWYRWFAVIERSWVGSAHWAGGRVALTGGGAVLTQGLNVGVARVSQGVVDVTFTTALPNANYAVMANARGVAGTCLPSLETTAGFRIERGDVAGTLVDADFNFSVHFGLVP